MLWPSDTDLVQRDTAIPGLALVLDPDALAEALRVTLPQANVRRAWPTYVRYKPATSCLVAYQLQTANGGVNVYAKAYRANARGKLLKARHRVSVPGPLGPGRIILEHAAVVAHVFPNDRRLPVLARLADADGRRQFLARLLPDRPDLWEVELTALRYKPERRYVARMTARGDSSALLKVYTESDYIAARRATRAFSSRDLLRVPQQLGHSDRYHALALEWLPGRSLNQAVQLLTVDRDMVRAAGVALAELHAQEEVDLAHLSRQAEIHALFSAANAVAAVCPYLGEYACVLAQRLAADLATLPEGAHPIHGDFSPDQVVLIDGSVGVLDLDAAVRGIPEADLGSFIARLERDSLQGDILACHAEEMTRALLEGYRAAGGTYVPARVGLYTATALLRLAPHCFRNRLPDWPEQTGLILARVGQIIRRKYVERNPWA